MYYHCSFAVGFYKIFIFSWFCSWILQNMNYHCSFAVGFYRICIMTEVLHAGGHWRPLAALIGPWRLLAGI